MKKYKTFGGFNKAFEKNNSQIISKASQLSAEHLKTNREFALVKGAMEQIVMIGSGVILTILCPLLVSKLVHPVMSFYDKMTAQKNKKNNAAKFNKTV